MGFVSNQWLNRGWGARDRSYNPIPVSIEVSGSENDSWATERKVLVEITAIRREDGQFQKLLLQKADLDKLVVHAVSHCSTRMRRRVAAAALAQLEESDLVAVFVKAVKRLTKGPKQHAAGEKAPSSNSQ